MVLASLVTIVGSLQDPIENPTSAEKRAPSILFEIVVLAGIVLTLFAVSWTTHHLVSALYPNQPHLPTIAVIIVTAVFAGLFGTLVTLRFLRHTRRRSAATRTDPLDAAAVDAIARRAWHLRTIAADLRHTRTRTLVPALFLGMIGAGVPALVALLTPDAVTMFPAWFFPALAGGSITIAVFTAIGVLVTPSLLIALSDATYARLTDSENTALAERFARALFPGPRHPDQLDTPPGALRLDPRGTSSLVTPRPDQLRAASTRSIETEPSTPATPDPYRDVPADTELAVSRSLITSLATVSISLGPAADDVDELTADVFTTDNDVYVLAISDGRYVDFPSGLAAAILDGLRDTGRPTG